MKLSLLFFILALPLTAISCVFPERSKSIIPPTSEQELCRIDPNYYYSTTFDFCFRLPNEIWKHLETSLPKDVAGTNISSIDYFLPDSKLNNTRIFTIFITRPSDQNLEIFLQDNIIQIDKEGPYLLGYRLANNSNLEESLIKRQSEVAEMLQSMSVFATLDY